MYSEKVKDHFMNPRNAGRLEDANAIGEVGNPTCGDVMKIYLKINDDEVIEDVKFETFGCGAAIATSSMITELIKGKHIADALKVTNKDVVDELDGLPPIKVHCSLLAEEGVEAAIANYYDRKKGRNPNTPESSSCDSCCGACGSNTDEHIKEHEEEHFVSEDHRVAD
jgi:nitrogen fixation NifU-like protein